MIDDPVEKVVWAVFEGIVGIVFMVAGGALSAGCALCLLTRVIRRWIDNAADQLTKRTMKKIPEVPWSEEDCEED
jgi:NhaP-type Na+/H+ or K+/H+ antiporter